MTFETKDDALDALEATRAEWLAAARAWARAYAKGGKAITINDVRRYGPPIPEDVDPRVAGAVFRERSVWDFHGYVQSKRRTSHGRAVAQFSLR